ncbi:putative pentatricopeptide repeat-containing protein At5g43820 [Aristolochia californica]|uniref:putative pentatricopeptide repeat-containing protein At5g43820 n=1 Tax=Aristolochia californica TaxID=171875 RepID=UPI0035DA3C5B
MALQTLKFAQTLYLHNTTRCLTFPLHLNFICRLYTADTLERSFDAHECSPTTFNSTNQIDEQFVLEQLSNLLPVHAKAPAYRQFVEKSVVMRDETRRIDYFLPPADKLRGIFLQKLKGKAAVESALSAIGIDLTIEIMAEVLNRGNLGGAAMFTFFNWAIKLPEIDKDHRTYHIILKALGRRRFFNFMEEILCQMKGEGINPNNETLTIVMDSFVRGRQLRKAIQFFERLEEFGSNRTTESFNVLLKCLCQRAHVRSANSLFNTMKEMIPINIETYNIIISGWSKLGRVNEIERNLNAMVAEGLNPNCTSLSYLIEGLGRAGRVSDSIDVFNKMETRGCVPDIYTCNAMISNFISIEDLDECLQFYKGMCQKNCEPNLATYTILINAFIKARRVADALEVFDEMLSKGIIPTTGSLTSFIEPLCSFGPPYAAMMLYKKSKKMGCKVSLKTYKLLLMRLSRFGKCGMVLKMWEEMQKSDYSSDAEVYEYVVNGFCNIGQLENAVFVMEEALGKGICPSKFVYSKLSNKLLNANKVEMAYKLFLKVKIARVTENARRYWRANGWHF